MVARAFPKGIGPLLVVVERAVNDLPQCFRFEFHGRNATPTRR
jgi:hypothetical protein